MSARRPARLAAAGIAAAALAGALAIPAGTAGASVSPPRLVATARFVAPDLVQVRAVDPGVAGALVVSANDVPVAELHGYRGDATAEVFTSSAPLTVEIVSPAGRILAGPIPVRFVRPADHHSASRHGRRA